MRSTRTPPEPWYGVRTLYRFPPGTADSSVLYEERVVVFKARSMEAAISLAEIEGRTYAQENQCEYLEYVLAFHIFASVLGAGTEVFSLMRDSALEPDAYIDTFFDTGAERAQL